MRYSPIVGSIASKGVASDAERIARVVTGTAVGLVLSGGSRAYCHIGAIRASWKGQGAYRFRG